MKKLLKSFFGKAITLILCVIVFSTASNAQCSGSALDFNGSTHYVNGGTNLSLKMTGSFTLEAWVYPTGNGGVYGCGNGGVIVSREGEYELARWNDGTVRFAVANSSPGWAWVNTGYVLPLNVWTHLALVHVLNGSIILYVNGSIHVPSTVATGVVGDAHPVENEFRIGGRQNCSQIFTGKIDEVRVWNDALTGANINTWKNKPVSGSHPNFANLKGYWRMDEGSGSTIADASGNGNTGNLVNAPTWVSSNQALGPVRNTNTGFTYQTIQEAINDPITSSGHTITVCQGTYNESVNITKSVNLRGAQAGNCAATRSGAESVINCADGIGVNASNVTINGFTIQNQTTQNAPGNGVAVYMAPPNTGTQLLNNIIRNNMVGSTLTNAGAAPAQVMIQCNWFDANNQPSVPANTFVTGFGILSNQSIGGGIISNVLIDGNKFTGHLNPTIDFLIATPANAMTGLTISNNEFDGNLRAFSFRNVVNSSFSSNLVQNSTFTTSGDVRPFGGVNNLMVNNNSFIGGAGNIHAVRISNDGIGGSPANSNITLLENSFVGYSSTNTAVEIVSGYTGSLSAECNWWNTISNSGIGALVTGSVDYTPWLLNGTDNSPAIGFQPVANSCGGGIPKLTTSINGVVVNANNDGNDDLGAFNVCNVANNILFDAFTDQNNLSDPNLRVYQTYTVTNVTVPFCNNCSATMGAFAGQTGTAALINPATSGTLVMRFRSWIDANTNGIVDGGEFASDWIIYTVTVNPQPINSCPGNITQSTDPEVCEAVINYTVGVSTSPAATVSYSFSGATTSSGTGTGSGSTFNKGTTNVTVISTNSCGSATCSFTVTVNDNEDPTITCPANVSATTNTGCTATGVNLGTPTTADNCTVASVTNDAPAAFPLGTTTVTWTVTDGSGNTATCTQTVTVTDNINPTITCPANVSATTNTACTATGVNLGTPTTADNCSVASVTNDAPAAFQLGNTTVTWTVTDGSGNMATCTQTVTVSDNINPTITCPANVSATTNTACTATGVNLGTPTTADNCSVASVTNNHPSTTYPLGTTIVTWIVTDGSGNTATCTQTVTVTDNINPTITCPAPVAKTTNSGCTATGVVLGTPVTADNCSIASVTNNHPSTTYPLGTTIVTWTVTDGSGNTATCTQTVTVTDNINPTITCPAPVAKTTNSGCTATGVVLGTPVTADNCSIASVTNNHPSTTYLLGTTIVTWTVTDGSGNTAMCTQTVTVTDNVNPTITCPANITVNPTSLSGAVVTYTAPVGTDNCSATTVRTSPANTASGSTFPIGTTTVSYRVTDGSGNSASCSFTVTVRDPYCDNNPNNKKVYVCHNGHTICISVNALPAHLAHGDQLGQCSWYTTSRMITMDEAEKELPAVKEDAFKVNVSPNPSNSDFKIQVTGGSGTEPIVIRILNANGVLQSTTTNITKSSAVSVGSSLRAGTYFAEVIQGKNRLVVKLIKMN